MRPIKKKRRVRLPTCFRTRWETAGAPLPTTDTQPWIQPGFLPWVGGLCPLAILFQLQTASWEEAAFSWPTGCWLLTGTRYGPNMPLSSAGARKMSQLHWPWTSESWVFPVNLEGTAWAFAMWNIAGAFFYGIQLRLWWLISPLITTGEETASER